MQLSIWVLINFLGLATLQGEDKKTISGVSIWDTGKVSAQELSAAELNAKSGWNPIREIGGTIQGDCVLANGRILGVIRRKSNAVELYCPASDHSLAHGQIGLQARGPDQVVQLQSVSVI